MLEWLTSRLNNQLFESELDLILFQNMECYTMFLQVSILVTLVSLSFINDFTQQETCDLSLFHDDVKIWR